jgi:hypothetical protein
MVQAMQLSLIVQVDLVGLHVAHGQPLLHQVEQAAQQQLKLLAQSWD